MIEFTIDHNYIERLIVKARAIMGREENDISNPGGNATDDQISANLQDSKDNLSREEFAEEIQGLSDEQQVELVALMWLGRDDAGIEDWSALVTQAAESRVRTTEDYLLSHPLVAEYWASGLDIIETH